MAVFIALIAPVQGSPQGHQQVALADHALFTGCYFDPVNQ
jgi:hypothetical protein